MNAKELYLKYEKSANIWYCSDCRIVAKSKEVADNCCKRNNCEYCGILVEEKYWTAHRECIDKNIIEKAEKLENWDGWVFYEDKYYTTIRDLIEELEDIEEVIPEYVFTCKTIPFHIIKIDDLLQEIEEASYEGIADNLCGFDTLSSAINDFNEDNKDLVSYLPDETKMVKTIGYLHVELKIEK